MNRTLLLLWLEQDKMIHIMGLSQGKKLLIYLHGTQVFRLHIQSQSNLPLCGQTGLPT